jgi:hypothetical protein
MGLQVLEVDVGQASDEVLSLLVQEGQFHEDRPIKRLRRLIVEDVVEGREDFLENGLSVVGQLRYFFGVDLGDALLEASVDRFQYFLLGLDLIILGLEIPACFNPYPAPPSINLLSLFFLALTSLVFLL